MKSEIKCKYCQKSLGEYHGYEESKILYLHFKQEHSKEYEELKETHRKLKDLEGKYGSFYII